MRKAIPTCFSKIEFDDVPDASRETFWDLVGGADTGSPERDRSDAVDTSVQSRLAY